MGKPLLLVWNSQRTSTAADLANQMKTPMACEICIKQTSLQLNCCFFVVAVIIITYKVTREARKLSHNIETDKTNAKFTLLAKSTKYLQKTAEISFKLCLYFKIQQIS